MFNPGTFWKHKTITRYNKTYGVVCNACKEAWQIHGIMYAHTVPDRLRSEGWVVETVGEGVI